MAKRVWEHKQGAVEGFTKEHAVSSLVYFEPYDDGNEAIKREKHIKKWNRAWKVELIEKDNPRWLDLYGEICG